MLSSKADPELMRLLSERENARVQLSLVRDRGTRNSVGRTIWQVDAQLKELEAAIAARRRAVLTGGAPEQGS